MRTFFTSLAGVIVLIIIVIVIVLFIGWSRVPDIVSNNISKKLKVYVDIDNINLGWGEIKIKKMEIGNPQGSVQQQAFKCQEIDIRTPFNNFFKSQVMIEEIDMNDVFLDLEFDSAAGTKGNWSKIMSNLQSSEEQQTPLKAKNDATSLAVRSVYIRKLILTNIDVDVIYIKEGKKIIHLPRIDRIELNDISSEGGLPVDQIMNSVLGQMLKSVFQKQNLKNMLQDFMPSPDNLQKFIQPFKGLFQATPPENENDPLILSENEA